MHEIAYRLAANPVTADDASRREFEARLADSSSLAFRVAFSVLRHHEDAEDVAQEAFAKAYRRFHRLRNRERFRSWLVRMTWRMALDRRRGDRRRLAREDAAAGPVMAGGEGDLIARDRAARLWTAIDRLPEKLRRVVVLSAIEGHSVRDVAALLGIPDGTVKSRQFEARKKLLEWLQ